MADFHFSVPANLNNLEVRNPVFHLLASDPGSPIEGLFWINTTTHLFKYYDGTNVIALGTLDKVSKAVADVDINSHKLTNVTNPTSAQDAATRGYVLGLTVNELTTPAADWSVNSHKITNLSDGTTANDAVNKGQLDGAVAGVKWKASVRAATTVNGALATAYENGDIIDGVTLATGDRILLKDQTAGAENGIYVVAVSGAPTRATDADTAAEILQAAVFVQEGTANADTGWVLSTNAPITLNTTALVFAQFTSVSVVAGAGLTLTGATLAVGQGTGITVNADDVAIDTAVVVRKYAVDVGDNSSTSITVTHNLGTVDAQVTVWDKTVPYAEVYPEVRHTSTTAVTLVFAVAPTTAQYRCAVFA